jgi:hypothetical protein
MFYEVRTRTLIDGGTMKKRDFLVAGVLVIMFAGWTKIIQAFGGAVQPAPQTTGLVARVEQLEQDRASLIRRAEAAERKLADHDKQIGTITEKVIGPGKYRLGIKTIEITVGLQVAENAGKTSDVTMPVDLEKGATILSAWWVGDRGIAVAGTLSDLTVDPVAGNRIHIKAAGPTAAYAGYRIFVLYAVGAE